MRKVNEQAVWKCAWKIEKFLEDIAPYRGREDEFYRKYRPYETLKSTGNCLLNTGINAIWAAVCGGTFTAFNSTYATIGVGDSSTAAAATQTDLQASTNKAYMTMDSGYPTYGTSQLATFKASFGTGEANFAWNEWVVKNSSSAVCLNRKAESLGTKASGTWTLTVTITLA